MYHVHTNAHLIVFAPCRIAQHCVELYCAVPCRTALCVFLRAQGP